MPLLTRPSIDWCNPDYDAIFQQRLKVLDAIRADARPDIIIADMKAVYREHPAQMICDWGVTYDPRNIERGLPGVTPFIPFDRQIEFMDKVVEKWRGRGDPAFKNKNLLVEKSRDMGITWGFISLSCVLCLLYDDMAVGVGSRKWELVDDLGNMDPILPKGRMFLKFMPREFRGGWDEKKHTKEGQIIIPDTRSVIDGEAGDDIGRGGRKAIYGVDEAAHLQHPESIDQALANNTNCKIEFSSVKGMANPFARRAHDGSVEKFVFDWRQDPRKNQAWYDDYLATYGATTTAQEVDRNYAASVEGVVIPGLWVQAAIDAHLKLGLEISGLRWGGLDVADLGQDKCALVTRHGILLTGAEEWPGTDAGDLTATTEHTFMLAERARLSGFSYDADGMGVGVRGPARIANGRRKEQGVRRLQVLPFQGSLSGERLYMPDSKVLGEDGKPLDRTNKDYFQNYKAQAYTALRWRFLQIYRAVVKGWTVVEPGTKRKPGEKTVDSDELIAIDSKIKHFHQLISELSQPVYKESQTGKLMVLKTPNQTTKAGELAPKSPNLADACNMSYAPRLMPLSISDDLLDRI
jgi:phage terminase large subunit